MKMGQLWMLFSGIGCLLLGISAQQFQNQVSLRENRHLQFSDSYYKALRSEQKGTFSTSPLGIDELLLMITYGANEEHKTFHELNNIVHLPPFKEFLESHLSVYKLLREKPQNVELMITNLMYVDKEFEVLPSYKNILKNVFMAQFTQVNFRNAALSAQKINKEVASLTKNKIKNVISSGSISGNTRAILMNVLYFKGNWKTKFDKESTTLRSFFQTKTHKSNVPTMYVDGNFKWFWSKEMKATIVEMPYQNEDFSMIIIAPDQDTSLKNVEDKLRIPAVWSELAKLDESQLKLYLPKFKVVSSLKLNSILGKMGVTCLFSECADLSAMSKEKDLFVSRIEQKVFLEVNEQGSEAAAVTTGFMENRFGEDPAELHVNRPFLAILRYKNLNLFMARITNPRV